ncbi:phosphatases II [Auriculariales sp. MPI-PUGE-AT-0066]|nr:phosphatases II [Auriculariales sp. MPI-PUGE-AT-0066]
MSKANIHGLTLAALESRQSLLVTVPKPAAFCAPPPPSVFSSSSSSSSIAFGIPSSTTTTAFSSRAPSPIASAFPLSTTQSVLDRDLGVQDDIFAIDFLASAMSSPTATTTARQLPVWLDNARSRHFVSRAFDVLDSRDTVRYRASLLSPRHARAARRDSVSSSDSAASASGAGLSDEVVQYYAAVEGLLPENQRKNRYTDILAFDRTRIGAPFRELHGGKYWIAAQAALPFTAHAMLSTLLRPVTSASGATPCTMLPRTVVQLTRSHESGRVKAHPYFPDAVGETMDIQPEGTAMPPISITLVARRQIPEAAAIVSTLQLVSTARDGQPSQQHMFNHFLYTAWPDHGVPADRATLVHFVPAVTSSSRDPNATPPTVVGCSAGVGRTGAFIAISSLMRANGLMTDPQDQQPLSRQAQHPHRSTTVQTSAHSDATSASTRLAPSLLGPLPSDLEADPVIAEIDAMREQRGRMVQTEGQMLFVYACVASAFQS